MYNFESEKGIYDSVELASFVPLWPSEMVLCFSRAELSEVFGRLGNDTREELELDASEWLP